MIRTLAVLAAAIQATGCASIVNDSTHPMKIETKRGDGTLVVGAECQVINDYAAISIKSGATAQVRRSSKDMDITCSEPGNAVAVGRAISRANAGLAGNIIFGGAIGAVIDHTKGTAYTYPTWVQLVFGKTLVFDRWTEKEGQPAPPRVPFADR